MSSTGHWLHFGLRAVQTRAPSSMTAAAQRAAVGASAGTRCSASVSSARVRVGAGRAVPVTARASTRRTLVSTTACRAPKANVATAAAV